MSVVVWFTGMSGAGKSTLAEAVRAKLVAQGKQVEILDGDAVRKTLHKHLGFSPEDIKENNRLIAGLAKERAQEADVVLVPIISPFRESRARAREIIGDGFIELYVESSEAVRVSRDPKGLYKKSKEGTHPLLIGHQDGIPYEEPEHPELIIHTDSQSVEESARELVRSIENHMGNPDAGQSEKVRTVFVIGSGKCGSTLLDLLLDGHSQMFGVGEMERTRVDSVCTCGKPAQECRVWKDAFPGGWATRREVYRSKLSFLRDRGPFLSTSTLKPLDEAEFISATIHAYRSVLAATGKNIIVDSSAQPDRADLLMRAPQIDPFFIYLVRDGRGVTWSYVRKYKRVFPFIFMWATMNLKNEWLLRRARRYGKVIFVKYEDLVRNPERELRRVCSALGIPYESQMLALRENEHHQVEGNRMRFAKDPIRADDAWRRDMPYELRAFFNVFFGWLNVYYRWYARRKHSAAIGS